MIVYRICQTYPPDHDPLDGAGAFKHGGRWNNKGTYVVYTAGSLALARSELARHINLELVPEGFRVYEIEIPDENYEELKPLPEDWNADPDPESTKISGDRFLKDKDHLCIKVPSVCDPSAYNYLLNPKSNDYDSVRIVNHYAFVP
ncbi:RES domain-containing protein [Fulvivirga sp. M361]|uniref:RES family NAD+ phosphorylase n=1 Tax=Fulvivirga sp. M361 TaxID=2594266 RepID=UPI00117AB6EA|nr:RES family NAD+ phosphorylase [Fulvivirga sp. M361]TRX58787.1 RES domain-containing protein [Fulvivirga sp. M361]